MPEKSPYKSEKFPCAVGPRLGGERAEDHFVLSNCDDHPVAVEMFAFGDAKVVVLSASSARRLAKSILSRVDAWEKAKKAEKAKGKKK